MWCDWQFGLERPTLSISRDLPFSFQPSTMLCFLLKVVDEIWNSSSHLPAPIAFLAHGGGCSSPSWSVGGWAVSGRVYGFQLGALRFLHRIQYIFFSFLLFLLFSLWYEKDQADHPMELGDLGTFDNVVLTCLLWGRPNWSIPNSTISKDVVRRIVCHDLLGLLIYHRGIP